MKIHMDYLEGRCEEYDNVKFIWEGDRKGLAKKNEERFKAFQNEMETKMKHVTDEMTRQVEAAELRGREMVEKYQRQIKDNQASH